MSNSIGTAPQDGTLILMLVFRNSSWVWEPTLWSSKLGGWCFRGDPGACWSSIDPMEESGHSIDNLNLSYRARGVLLRANIRSVETLQSFSETDLLQIQGCGRRVLNEVKEALKNLGVTLRTPGRRG